MPCGSCRHRSSAQFSSNRYTVQRTVTTITTTTIIVIIIIAINKRNIPRRAKMLTVLQTCARVLFLVRRTTIAIRATYSILLILDRNDLGQVMLDLSQA